MKDLIRQFGRLRLTALVLTLLPLAVLPLAGTVWLWQSGHLGNWLLLVAACGAAAWLLHLWSRRRDRRRPPGGVTQAAPNWSEVAEGAWLKVETLANASEPQDYSLSDGGALWRLAKHTLEAVAQHFHPQQEQPVLALTVPHTLLIVERASRELRQQIVHSLPLSHQLTLGTLVRARRWQQVAARYHNVYRVGRAIANPATALYKEFSRAVGAQILDFGSDRIQRWLLQEYVRKVGFYAIELYSGNLLLNGTQALPNASENPVRLLVLGRAGSGKSSLVKSLTGGSAEPVPEQSGSHVQAYRLQSADWGELLIWDTPAWDTLPRRHAKRAVSNADMILWVSHLGTWDATYEAGQLRRLERWLREGAGAPETQILVAMSHADQGGDDLHIRCAQQMGVPPERLLLINLADPHHPEAVSSLHRALHQHHPQAARRQYWRHLSQRKRDESRDLTAHQLRNIGSNAWRVVKGVFSRDR